MIQLFNVIILVELLTLLLVLALCHGTLAKHWRTSLAGCVVLLAVAFVNVTWLLRFHCVKDTLDLMVQLAIVIALFLAADG